MSQILTIPANSQSRPLDFDPVELTGNPQKNGQRSLILGIVTLIGISAGFWAAVTLTIARLLR